MRRGQRASQAGQQLALPAALLAGPSRRARVKLALDGDERSASADCRLPACLPLLEEIVVFLVIRFRTGAILGQATSVPATSSNRVVAD